MDAPSTDGLYETVVGDDLRDVGVPMLLFLAPSVAAGGTDDADPGPEHQVTRAAVAAGVALDGLAMFGTDAYRLQRALGEQIMGPS